MNAEQLQAIKDRADKATPGPWIIEESRFGNFNAASENENYDLPARLMNEVDAQFVTNAREDIPALIAEVERLQKRLALSEKCYGIMDKCALKLHEQNKQLRAALENGQEQLFSIRGANGVHDNEITSLCIQIRKALAGESNAI